ncbi:MAG: Crp/Fnr family transcriptional regulator [Pseudomonadota bacterium]|nr:Crp/Fnr family transcriptional regulator [Pseudomonadota bacterium]
MNIETVWATSRRMAPPLTLVAATGNRSFETGPMVTAFAPGQTLLRAGEHGVLWRVTSGAFRVERQGDDASTLIQLALPGDRVGLESLLAQPYAVTVSALVASTAWIESVHDEAARLMVLADILAQQQRQAQDMARLRSGPVTDRLTWLVHWLGGGIDNPMARKALPSLKEMAQLVDSAPETVCRELGRLMPSQKTPHRRRATSRTRAASLAAA